MAPCVAQLRRHLAGDAVAPPGRAAAAGSIAVNGGPTTRRWRTFSNAGELVAESRRAGASHAGQSLRAPLRLSAGKRRTFRRPRAVAKRRLGVSCGGAARRPRRAGEPRDRGWWKPDFAEKVAQP